MAARRSSLLAIGDGAMAPRIGKRRTCFGYTIGAGRGGSTLIAGTRYLFLTKVALRSLAPKQPRARDLGPSGPCGESARWWVQATSVRRENSGCRACECAPSPNEFCTDEAIALKIKLQAGNQPRVIAFPAGRHGVVIAINKGKLHAQPAFK